MIWTPADDPLWKLAAFWTPCCCTEEMIVVCHSKGATSHSTGTVSRVSPDDGSVIWTVDLGTDSGTSRPRVGYRCAIDSTGNVYVVWLVSNNAGGTDNARVSLSGPPGGVRKYDRNGNLLASLDFTAKNASYSTGGLTGPIRHPRIRVDPSHDDRIYVGIEYDDAGNWLYRLDAGLNVIWGIGPAETVGTAVSRCTGIGVDTDGNVYAVNSANDTIWKFDSDGNLLDSELGLLMPDALIADLLSNKMRIGGRAGSLGVDTIYAYQADFSTVDWAKDLTDFSYPLAGSWDALSETTLNSGAQTTNRFIFGDTTELSQWNVAAGGTRRPSLFAVDDSGTVQYAAIWGTATVSASLDMASDQTTQHAYTVGEGADSGATRLVGRIDPADGSTLWTAPILTAPSSCKGWGVDARTINLT